MYWNKIYNVPDEWRELTAETRKLCFRFYSNKECVIMSEVFAPNGSSLIATDLELSTKIDAAEDLAAGLCSNYATRTLVFIDYCGKRSNELREL